MTAAVMNALTAQPAATGGTVKALRAMAFQNTYASALVALTTKRSHVFRFKYTVASGDRSDCICSFANDCLFNAALPVTGQDIIIDECFVGYPTGSVQKQVTWSGATTKTLAWGAADIVADTIYPADLGLSTFPVGTVLWGQGVCHVANSGEGIPVSRFPAEENNSNPGTFGVDMQFQAHMFDPTAPTAVSCTAGGPYTYTGTIPQAITGALGFSFIMTGHFVSGDPITRGILGDSITYSGGIQTSMHYSNIDADHVSNPVAGIKFCIGGQQQSDYVTQTLWRNYLKYFRVMTELIGTNQATLNTSQFSLFALWDIYRAGGIEKIIRAELPPKVPSFTGTHKTEAEQGTGSLLIRGFNSSLNNLYRNRSIAALCKWSQWPTGIRGAVDPNKWGVDGATAYLTILVGDSGTHPGDIRDAGTHGTPWGQTLMEAELRPIVQAVTVPAP